MKIGIFGGSFDPIHYGHLVLAENVREGAGLDKIIIMPAFESPFKIGRSGAGTEHRMNMVELAVERNDFIKTSSYEIDKGRISYTADTLDEIREMYYPDDELCFITGTDSMLGIEKWKDRDKLLKEYSFAVGTRPGYKDEELYSYAEHLRSAYGTKIYIINIPKVDISSTNIRIRRMEGRSIKYLLPDKVEDYIIEHGLYK